MHIIAQTPRFVIREFTAEDEKIYLALFDDKKVTLHLPKRNRQENLQMFRESIRDYAPGNPLGRWGMFNNGDKEFIGICLLRKYAENAAQIELGYVLGQKFWGMGIAGEMAQIMVAYAFTHTGSNEIVAVTTLQNIGSQRVLEKAGLERRGIMLRDGEELAFFCLKRLG